MNLENRLPKQVRDRAEELTRGYHGPKGRSPEARDKAKQALAQRQKEHPDWVEYFDTLPEAVRRLRERITPEESWVGGSIVAPMDEPGEFGYCVVVGGAGIANSIWAGRRLVAHEMDLTKEILDSFLTGLDTDTIEEV